MTRGERWGKAGGEMGRDEAVQSDGGRWVSMCRLPGNGGGVCWREEGGVGRAASAGRRARTGLGRGGFDSADLLAHNIVATSADSS